MRIVNKKGILILLLVVFMFCTGFSMPKTSDDFEKILSEMSIEEKVGQIIMPAFRKWNGENLTVLPEEVVEVIEKYQFGGVTVFSENCQGTEQLSRLTSHLQSISNIPMLIAIDQEGGYITRLNTGTTTVGNMALGAAEQKSYTRASGEIIGSELNALGVNVNFGPVMDVNSNPSNPIIGVRSFSDDLETVGRLGGAYIEGLHKQNVMSALKHFPGHGDTDVDSHTGLPSIDKSLEEIEQFELVPFKKGIKAGADIVMTAHIEYPQIEKETYTSKKDGEEITLPATLSKTIITDVLRNKLGFEGVVTTDAMEMSAIAEHFDLFDASRLAIEAGVDILLMPVSVKNEEDLIRLTEYMDKLIQMVKDGEIANERIDESVLRILKLKQKYDLFEEDNRSEDERVENALKIVGSKKNHDIEWEIAKNAVTLVKNEDILPYKLKDNNRVTVFCSYDNEVNCIKYAFEKLKEEKKIPESVKLAVIVYTGETALKENHKISVNKSDLVLASVETYRTANITGGFQASFLDDLIEYTHNVNKKIVISSIQLPYDLARYQKADALLSVYCAEGMDELPKEYNGEQLTYGLNLSAAVYDIFGGNEFNGKLPVDILKLDDELNYTDEILYPRGFSLAGDSPLAWFKRNVVNPLRLSGLKGK